ncbi:GntR family transcriptional regulator [Bacillus sp. 165]|uniref:FadR/GntR family transcriptional regulator n=1 Tax=Bacillus sp. 165 TaxID=1529117 RepID=UPI001AD97DCB|nr:GntR family transcriptional regulator [Bacillus sp. 165]MBO9130619.1 FadR family transcriptional regulator [Bacillus sp. 165]
MTDTQTKVYLEIVNKIRAIITEDALEAGDKLPSERELSSRLAVGRSSVREALRALELLGLIETRRGEGTFVKNFYEHGLVKLIGTFLLQDEKTKKDLLQTKLLLEKDALRLLCEHSSEGALQELKDLLSDDSFPAPQFHQIFFAKIVEKTQNYLLYRIWSIASDYFSSLQYSFMVEEKSDYWNIYRAIERKNETEAIVLYNALTEKIVSN